MTTTSQLMKNLCETPGVANFSGKFLELIEKLHEEKGSCFLCNNIFTTDPALKKIENSSWSQLFPFLKKAGIPTCILGLAPLVNPLMEKNDFNYVLTKKMETYDLCHILSEVNSGGIGTLRVRWTNKYYKSFDIEKILLEILDEFDEAFENILTEHVGDDAIPNFESIEEKLVTNYDLPGKPMELTPKIYHQAAIICRFLDFEIALNGSLEKLAKEKVEYEKNLAECLQMFENYKKSSKKSQKKSKKKSVTQKSSRPRIVRTKFNGAPKPKKSEGEDKMSLDGNKFHRRFKKTKRNVRI